jgi:hypothetical protein
MLSEEEKRRASLWFDFMSVVDHTYKIMGEATQDAFATMSSDMDYIVETFSYLDELQAKAIERRVKRERAFAIVGAVLTIGFTFLGAAGFFSEAIMAESATVMAMAPFQRLLALAGTRVRRLNTAAAARHLPVHGGTHNLPATTSQIFERQLQNLNAAAGGILGSGYNGVTGLMNQMMKMNYKKDE